MSEGKGTSWYSHLKPGEIDGKHVRVTLDDGTVIDGRFVYDQSDESVWLGSTPLSATWDDGSTTTVPCPEVLWYSEDEQWHPLDGIKSLDLVWDEHDWGLIDVKDLRHGDAVVANGRLYKVSAIMPGSFYSQVLTDTPLGQCIPVYLVSCALRRKVNVPVKPGFYQDRLGKFWARSVKSTDDGPWWSLELDSLGQPAKSDKDIANLMPLTPAHFAVGEAEESDDAGPFEGLIQYLMTNSSIAGGSTASTGR